MEQLSDQLLQQLADQWRLDRREMQVVDDQHEDASGGVSGGPGARQDDALGSGRGWGRRRLQDVEHAAAVNHHQRRDLLRSAVLEHLEVVLAEVRHELAVGGAGNHVEGHEVDADPKRRLLRRAGAWGLSARGDHRDGAQHGDEHADGHGRAPRGVSHRESIAQGARNPGAWRMAWTGTQPSLGDARLRRFSPVECRTTGRDDGYGPPGPLP